MKKLLSIILAVSMLLSMAAIGVSAAVSEDGNYIPSQKVETNRYYFYMPQTWCNEYANSAGIFWFDPRPITEQYDEDLTVSWPGYKACKGDVGGVYYSDCPKEVNTIIWNNTLYGSEDKTTELYRRAHQTKDISVEYISKGDSDIYSDRFFEYIEESYKGDKSALGEYADNFFMEEELGFGLSFTMDNMIYVVDPKLTAVNYDGKLIYSGEWYFYYGNGEYGNYPVKEDAENYGIFDQVVTYDSSKLIYFDVSSTYWIDFGRLYCHIWNNENPDLALSWNSRESRCAYDETTEIASFDLTNLDYDIKDTDGKEYLIIFHCDQGYQTYNNVMSGACIGDTMYCTGEMSEHQEDEDKVVSLAVWENNPDCGPLKLISSTGNVLGTTHVEGTSDETILADYLIRYCRFADLTETTKKLVNELNVLPDDVMDVVILKVGEDDPDGVIPIIRRLLEGIEDPETKFECDINGDKVTNIADATVIQKFVAQMVDFTPEQKKAADINGDGIVNITDTTLIQKKLAGIS